MSSFYDYGGWISNVHHQLLTGNAIALGTACKMCVSEPETRGLNILRWRS
jgi:hypothetical protein